MLTEARRIASNDPPCLVAPHRYREVIAQLVARVARLEEALREIAAIENEMVGGDWDEIEQARVIAIATLREGGG